MNIIKLLLLAVLALGLFPCANAGICSNMDLNRNEYACGKNYYEPDYFTQNPATTDCRCCCRDEDGSGFHLNTCDDGDSNPFRSVPKGCWACMGDDACREALSSKIGDNSCVGDEACHSMNNSKIKKESCHGTHACREMKSSNVGIGSCMTPSDDFSDYDRSCKYMQRSNVGSSSCQGEKSCYLMDDSNVGNNSCQIYRSCYHAYKTQVGNNSCQGNDSCYGKNYSNVGNNSCQGYYACLLSKSTQVGDRSCHGDRACRDMRDSTVGDYSCQSEGSCRQLDSTRWDDYGNRLTIGSNACNLSYVCRECENDSVVPDWACISLSKFDYTWKYEEFIEGGKSVPTCNYCRSEYRKLSTYYASTSQDSSRRRLTEVDLNISCKDLAEKLKNYIIEHVEAVEMFKKFVHQVVDNCSGKPLSNLVEFTPNEDNGTCTVKINLLLKTRLRNGHETPLVELIKEKVNEFCASKLSEEFGLSCDSIEVTDEVIEEKDCIKAAGSESSMDSNSSINEGGAAKAGKDGKSSQAEAVERHRTREHESKSGKGKNGK